MRIAIIGSSGYIASFLIRKLEKEEHKVIRIDQTEDADFFLNLLEPKAFDYSVLDDVDFIIFTAAISSPDKCATDYKMCWDINVEGTSYLIREAITRKCRVLFFSSDAVFGEDTGEIFDENSDTNAKTPYGRMKKEIEDRFKFVPGFKAIRLSYVASKKDKFISYCISCADKDETAEVFHPFYRNVIVINDVVDIVLWFINNWEQYEPFVLNVAGNELISRVRIVDELNRFLNKKIKVKILFPGEDFYKNRPQITQMKSLYLKKYNILKEESFTEKIRKEFINGGL